MAAASTPAWRIAPPNILRNRCTRVIVARSPHTAEPTGAPSPLLKQQEMVMKMQVEREKLDLKVQEMQQKLALQAQDHQQQQVFKAQDHAQNMQLKEQQAEQQAVAQRAQQLRDEAAGSQTAEPKE